MGEKAAAVVPEQPKGLNRECGHGERGTGRRGNRTSVVWGKDNKIIRVDLISISTPGVSVSNQVNCVERHILSLYSFCLLPSG